MKRIHLATGLAFDGDRVLVVASRYPSHPQPLWNLPGGRQRPHELLTQTVRREVREETGLDARVGALAYVSESYDGGTHFTNTTFHIDVSGTIALPSHDDHVVAVEYVPRDLLVARLVVRVVREPLLAYLDGLLPTRYAGFAQADVSVWWDDES